jgi:hypothetical protein
MNNAQLSLLAHAKERDEKREIPQGLMTRKICQFIV